MSPRQLRDAITAGEWTAVTRKYPEPPPEWPQYRRDRMRVAVRCAVLFLVHGKVWHEIVAKLRRERVFESDLTRARMNQYVDKGMKFLLDRGVFQKVSDK